MLREHRIAGIGRAAFGLYSGAADRRAKHVRAGSPCGARDGLRMAGGGGEARLLRPDRYLARATTHEHCEEFVAVEVEGSARDPFCDQPTAGACLTPPLDRQGATAPYIATRCSVIGRAPAPMIAARPAPPDANTVPLWTRPQRVRHQRLGVRSCWWSRRSHRALTTWRRPQR